MKKSNKGSWCLEFKISCLTTGNRYKKEKIIRQWIKAKKERSAKTKALKLKTKIIQAADKNDSVFFKKLFNYKEIGALSVAEFKLCFWQNNGEFYMEVKI